MSQENYSHIVVKMMNKWELIDHFGPKSGLNYWERGALWCVYNSAVKQIISVAYQHEANAQDSRDLMVDYWENDCDTSRF